MKKILTIILTTLIVISSFTMLVSNASTDTDYSKVIKLGNTVQIRRASSGLRVTFTTTTAAVEDENIIEVGAILRNDAKSSAEMTVDAEGNLVNPTAQVKVPVFSNNEQVGVINKISNNVIYFKVLLKNITKTYTNYSFSGYAIVKEGNDVRVINSSKRTLYYNSLTAEDIDESAAVLELGAMASSVYSGGEISDYETPLAKISKNIYDNVMSSEYDKETADTLGKQYIDPFIDILYEKSIVTSAEKEELVSVWGINAQTNEDYANYLTDDERALPGAIPSVLVDLSKKIELLKAGTKLTESECSVDLQRLYKYFKVYIDSLGENLTRTQVETVRKKYQVTNLSKLLFKGSSQKITLAREEFNDTWRAKFYLISVYEGVSDWEGKDDGWSPEIHYPSSDDDDEEEEP